MYSDEKEPARGAATAKCDCCGGELDEGLICVSCADDAPAGRRLVPDPLWDGDPRRPDMVLVDCGAYRTLCRSCCSCYVATFAAHSEQST